MPQTFPIPSPPAVASFDFQDIAEGTGIITFNGAVHEDVTTTSYLLTTNEPFSGSVVVSGAKGAASATTLISDNTYSVEFNRPQNVKGKTYLNITLGGTTDGSETTKFLALSGAKLQHWDGTTATDLAEVSGAALHSHRPS